MSKLRVLVGTRKGAFILTADGARKRWKVSGPHFAGWEIYHVKGSTVDPNRIYASQTSAWFGQIIQRSDDGGKSWNTPGSSPEELKGPDGTPKAESNKLFTTESQARINGMTAPSIRGNSSAFGIWSPLYTIPNMFTQGWKTRRCLNQRMAENRGTNCPVSGSSTPARNGNRAQAECVYIQSSWIQRIDSEYSWRSRPQARFAPMTAEQHGNLSITDCIQNIFPIPLRRSAIVFIASPCIHRGPTHCSCKNTGT